MASGEAILKMTQSLVAWGKALIDVDLPKRLFLSLIADT